ncbi:MAG TPA: hypothetical protein VJN18_32655 [Polyangiaceae bacterium]|nr:hypothetical protein [Polyangiaceae bacterium]
MTGMLFILKIEIDGHFHGSADVPKPWVAEILGTDPRYGLKRTFLRAMNDWSEARRACSGNVYGRVARFPLRDGRLYEVARLRGSSSRRHMAREFVAIDGGKRVALEVDEALGRIDGGAPATALDVDEGKDGSSWVARIRGLGMPEVLGWVVVGERRRYRLRDGLYEVSERGARRFVGVAGQSLRRLNPEEALSWLGR